MIRATCERIFFFKKGGKSLFFLKKLFKADLILTLPTSCDLWTCEGNLSFATFRLFFFHVIFFFLTPSQWNSVFLQIFHCFHKAAIE